MDDDISTVLSTVQEAYRKLSDYTLKPGTDEFKVDMHSNLEVLAYLMS